MFLYRTGIISSHQDHYFLTLYSTVCLMCPLQKSQEFAGKTTKLTWGGSLISVSKSTVCTAVCSRLFPYLIIKSKVKGFCLTSKSQIPTHSTGKKALKQQKTVTNSWTYFSWQFNSSSSTSTNCAQGRDVMNNWCGVVEPCSEGEQALEHREIVHLYFFLPFLPSTINSPPCPWTRNQADTWAMVGCRPSAQSPSSGAAAGSINHTPVKGSGGLEEQLDKAAFQGMDVRVKDKHSTAATGNNKKNKKQKVHFSHFPFSWSWSTDLSCSSHKIVHEVTGEWFLPVLNSWAFLYHFSHPVEEGTERVALVATWNPAQPTPVPSPTFPSRAAQGGHGPAHQTQLWAPESSSAVWFSGSNTQRWLQLSPARHLQMKSGCFPDEFFSSDLQHHLKQDFITYYNFYCIL